MSEYNVCLICDVKGNKNLIFYQWQLMFMFAIKMFFEANQWLYATYIAVKICCDKEMLLKFNVTKIL